MSSRGGLTLLEMLIALALTGIVAFIALDMFAGQQANYTRTREKVKLQDNAREAVRIMELDVRNAGFRTAVFSEPTGLAGAFAKCANVFDKDSAAFTAGNRATIAGDTLRVRYIEPDAATGQSSCGYGAGSSFREIGYMQRNDTLFRMNRTDTTTAPTWVELLYNVVTYQVEYGLLTDPTDVIASNAQLTTAANWTGGTASTTAGVLKLQGWNATKIFSYYNAPVLLNPLYTYQISFDLSLSANMRSGADAIDSNTTTRLPDFQVGFFDNAGAVGVASDAMVVYPGDPAASLRHIELYINPGTTGNRFLGILSHFKSGANASSSQNLTITNARLSVASRGQYFTWVDAPSTTQRSRVKAIKINLLAKTSHQNKEGVKPVFNNLDATGSLNYTAMDADTAKTHILYQRIIPVVNNGL